MYNFKRADFVGINNYLSSLNFAEIFHEKSLEDKVECIHEAISSAIQRFVPSYEKKTQSKVSMGEQRLANDEK